MTDTPAAPETQPSAPFTEAELFYSAHRPDPILQVFASMAQNASGFEMGITLTVKGTVVTGTLIGRNVWLSRLVARASEAGEASAQVAQVIRDSFETPVNDGDDDDGSEDIRYGYLHLENARFVFDQRIVPEAPNPGALWRGRLVDVSGWCWGTLIAAPN